MAMDTITALQLEPVQRLTRDLKTAALTLSPDEARYLVDAYYTIQDYRKAAFNQERALSTSREPHDVISWLAGEVERLEHQVQRALDAWTDGHETGRWAKSITGIGPVIAAGLLAHIDIEKSPTAGHIWRFAGLDPSLEWLGKERAAELVKAVCGGSGGREVTAEQLAVIAARVNRRPENIRHLAEDETGRVTATSLQAALAKRPWNTPLKTICWKIGESFVKVQNNPKDFYGKLLAERKVAEWGRNLRGEFREQARDTLGKKNIGRTTEAYKWYSGAYIVPAGYQYPGTRPELAEGAGTPMLPPDHIHSRAKRWAVKLFLAHYQFVAYCQHYGKDPPLPYVITYLEHRGEIRPPNWPMK